MASDTTEDYYEILEVHRNASPEVIARAYRVLAARYHPDSNAADKAQWAEEQFKRLTRAMEVLSDPARRADYDRRRDARSATAAGPQSVSDTRAAVAMRCAAHAERKRESVCAGCHCGLCAECRTWSDGRPYCSRCVTARAAVQHPEQTATRGGRRPRARGWVAAILWPVAVLAACAVVLDVTGIADNMRASPPKPAPAPGTLAPPAPPPEMVPVPDVHSVARPQVDIGRALGAAAAERAKHATPPREFTGSTNGLKPFDAVLAERGQEEQHSRDAADQAREQKQNAQKADLERKRLDADRKTLLAVARHALSDPPRDVEGFDKALALLSDELYAADERVFDQLAEKLAYRAHSWGRWDLVSKVEGQYTQSAPGGPLCPFLRTMVDDLRSRQSGRSSSGERAP